ncbi:F-box/LRR-repeat protein 15 isoform X2 [Syngnathoides biaculeatus]|uniref:F-box/LRR-repeat protein 15 isoform X2 n=1 Tax=Syngnathoides biaculeatus TaxID=300417 RepID=UPI002ADD415B|nr:F-box/LRR-repeat protein 15 isoform X2 [Syngnathoides biaculeatus]
MKRRRSALIHLDANSEKKVIKFKMDEEEQAPKFPFLALPWDDILVPHILSYLPLTQLVILQRVSKQFRSLIRVFFARCRSFELEAVGSLLKDSRDLRKLSLVNCSSWLTDEELLPVINRNRRLMSADLSGCVGLTSRSLVAVSLNCVHLQRLAVARCHFVDGPLLRVLADRCGALRWLDLSGCCQLNDDGICYLAKKCAGLSFLSLATNEKITDESVEEVAKNCRSLQHLNLRCCLRVRDRAIRTVAEYCPTLKSLKVKHCPDVTESSLEPLRKRNVLVDVPSPPGRERLVAAHYGPYVNLQMVQVYCFCDCIKSGRKEKKKTSTYSYLLHNCLPRTIKYLVIAYKER